MVSGKGTIGGMPNEAVNFAKVTDGLSNTIMVIENSGHDRSPNTLRALLTRDGGEQIINPGIF